MASNLLATYSPSDVTVVIAKDGFSHVVSGFAEDGFVNIERNSETFEMYTGADDTNTRIYKPNTASQVTLSLQQSSNSLDILSQLYMNDRATRDYRGLFSITVKDNSGRSVFSAAEAYIGVIPNADFGSGMSTRDWVIHCPRTDYFLGGNSRFDAADADSMSSLGATIDPRWVA